MICKVWNIKGKKKAGSGKSDMKCSIGYILDEEKVNVKPDDGTSKEFASEQLGRECRYVEDDVKTMDGAYVGTVNLASSDLDGAVKEMMEMNIIDLYIEVKM